jgi:hypothetical protein
LFGFPTPPSYIQATLKTHTTMKIKKTATPAPSFQPISFTFTIESEEELKALQMMSRINVSIPELLPEKAHQGIIYDFLEMIYDIVFE